MKKITLLFGTALLMLLPMKAWSQAAYTWLSEDGKTFTFCYDDQKSSREGTTYYLSSSWYEDTKNVETVIFNSEFANVKPTSTKNWFRNMSKITEIPTINYLNTSSVSNMSYMFSNCQALQVLDLSTFDTGKVRDMSHMFDCCYGLMVLDISNFNTSNVTTMAYMFWNCQALTSLNVSSFNTANVENIYRMFCGCSSLASLDLSNFDTDKITAMQQVFYDCKALTSLNLSSFNTAGVTDMFQLFMNCSSLTSLDLSNFDTSNVSEMQYLFSGCSKLKTLNISSFNTEKVMSMANLFYNCQALTSLDLSKFNTASVSSMAGMFYNCKKLKNLDLSSFETTLVSNMSGMFYGCSGLTSLDLSNFNTDYYISSLGIISSYLKTTSSMFEGCSNLTDLDVSKLNMSVVTSSDKMFKCPKLHTLKISPTMGAIDASACNGVGSADNPCILYAPNDFDFGDGVDTSGDYFLWKAGYFKLYEVEIVISSAGLATFCYDQDLDFSNVTEYKAYVVGGYNSETGNVTLVRVKDVPAGTGIIIKGTAGNYKVPVGESKSLLGNYLIGTTEAVTIQPTEGNKTNLVLSSKNGKIGFYTISSPREVGANKAYLQLPTSILSANGMGLEFEDGTTNIDGVEAVDMPDVVWYTIDGRKLDAEPTQKGLYIANGRKVVVP